MTGAIALPINMVKAMSWPIAERLFSTMVAPIQRMTTELAALGDLAGEADHQVEALRPVLDLERPGVAPFPAHADRPLDAHGLDGLGAAQRLHQQ